MPFTDDMIAKYLQDPLSFPPEFKSWFVKYLEQHQPSLQAGLLAGKLPTSKLTGQIPYSQLTLANSIVSGDIVDGTIVNADINTAAAIAASKLAAYPTDATKVLTGDGSWQGGVVKAFDTTLLSATGTIDTGASPLLPTTFAHMRVEMIARGTQAATTVNLTCRMNNDSTSSHYFDVFGQDSDTTHTPGGDVGTTNTLANIGFIVAGSAVSGHFSAVVMDIPGYASAADTKPFIAWSYGLWNSGTGNQTVRTAGGVWAVSGTAINRLTFGVSAGNLDVGTRCTVYVWGA